MVSPVWNLLSRARESQLSSLGTTGLAVSIAGCLWLIRVVAKLSGEARKTGWKTVAKDWKSHIKEGLIGAGLTALVWCCLFAWNVYKVLNADYQRLSFLEADYPKQKEQADRVKGLEKQIQDLQSKPAPDNRPRIIYRTKNSDDDEKAKRKQIRAVLAGFLVQGQTLMRMCADEAKPAPEAEANKWVQDVETYLGNNLGIEYVPRFRNDAGMPLGITSIQDAKHRNLQTGIEIRVFNLDKFIAELKD